MKKTATPQAARIRRHARVRRRVEGSAEKPRLCVYRSLSHIYAQVIDDVSRVTLVAASDVAKMVGTLVAQRAKQKGISKVVFDRGGYPFHGRIKALAEAARAGGLDF